MSKANGRIEKAIELCRVTTNWVPADIKIINAAAAELLARGEPNDAERRTLGRLASADSLRPEDRVSLSVLEDRADLSKPEERVVRQALRLVNYGPSRPEPMATPYDGEIMEAEEEERKALEAHGKAKRAWIEALDASRALEREAGAKRRPPDPGRVEAARARIQNAEDEMHEIESAWLRRRARAHMLRRAASNDRALEEYKRSSKK